MSGISAEDWKGMYHVAARRADAAEAEVKRLKKESASARPAMRQIPTTPIAVGAPMPPPPDGCASVTERQLRAELQVLREASRWIPVEEDEPEPGVVVLVSDGRTVCSGHQNTRTGEWNCEGFMEADAITHWRPLPEGPK